MNELENRGNLPPEVSKPREGYREMKVCFLSSGQELISKGGFKLSDGDRIAVDHIRGSLKKKHIDDSLDGYLIKEHSPAKEIENKPPKKHINFSKLFDFAIYAVGIAEILAVLRWIV